MKKLWDLKKALGNLEAEGQGRGTIIGVTRLLLLGQFYTIKIQFYVLLCTRLYFQHIFLWHNFQWRFWNRIRRNLHAVPTVKNAPRKLPSLPEVNLNFGNKQMAKRTSVLNLYVHMYRKLILLCKKKKMLWEKLLFYDHYCTYLQQFGPRI